jgi:predicted Abi (CAAX) family protease
MTIRSLASRRWNDLRAALATAPDARTWVACALVFATFLLGAGSIGFASGLLRPTPPHLSVRDALVAGVLLLIQPALVEEIVFRGLLLPRDVQTIPRRRLVVIALSALAVYVASHPLNAWLFRPDIFSLFASPAYLVLAALLGLTCTIAYFISRSIWPPVAIHWLTVVTWIWFLGGQARLHM